MIQAMVTRPCTDQSLISFHQLLLLAFFFAMRSCEYLKVTDKEADRRTKPLRVRNLQFIKDHRILDHSDPNLEDADTLTITFEFQKRDQRDDSVTQERTDHPVLCPVRAGAAVVQRIRAIAGSDEDTYLYNFTNTAGKADILTGTKCLKFLRAFIRTIDPAYGINAEDTGLHSLRSSAAMAMYLNLIPVCTIMLLGRWSSDAFLRYIRKQVAEFSKGVSRKMIQRRVYYHVPDSNHEDPRTHNPMAASANLGMGANGAAINRSVFSVWE